MFCFSPGRLLLFLLFTVTGAVILAAFALLLGSLSFWFLRADAFAQHMVNSSISFATYPDGIFHGAARFLLFQILPVGMVEFDWGSLARILFYTVLICALAVVVFYRGLRRYASSNLMEARM